MDNTFGRLKEDLDDVLRSLLEEQITEEDTYATKSAKTLYAGCMNIGKYILQGAVNLS